jgi:branched-chain amino acid transport system substrate-binding protein
MQRPRILQLTLAAVAVAMTFGNASAQTQGVSRDEVKIATITDLSGPLAGYGKDIRNGMQLRVAEINEQGGIHGRKLTLLVEDAGYDPKRTVLAAQKLVNQDKVFAIVGTFGSAHTNAAMPVMFAKNVFSLFPLALSRDMYEPVNKFKYALISSYFDQMNAVVPKLYKDKGAKKACAIYQDDDYGIEVLKGAEAGLKAINVEVTEKTSFKRGATDFSSQVARMKAAGCDFVVMGTLIRESVGTIAESRRVQFSPTFVAPSSAYTDLIPKLGGKGMDGFYAATTAQQPYLDDASQPLRFWANKYQTRYNEPPTVFSVYGYTMIDVFARALQKGGSALTSDSFGKTMDSMNSIPGDIFGNPPMSFSPANHLASTATRLSQIQDGRWKVVYDYGQMK